MARPDSWFRFYNTAVDNPKVQRLPDALFKAWVNVLCLASRHGGRIPPPADVAFALRVRESVAAGWLDALESRKLLDRDATGLTPHDWNELQYKTDVSTDRVRRFRARSHASSATPAATPPETDETVSETAPESEQSQTPEKTRETEAAFAQFWDAYPEKIGRKAALVAWMEAVDRPDTPALLEAVARYARSKPADRAWCAPARWLREGRWNDVPASSSASSSGTASEPSVSGRTAQQWRWGAKLFAAKRYWPPSFGPEPGVAGCACPTAILQEFGIADCQSPSP